MKDLGDAKEFMNILSNRPQAHTCYAKKMTGYALQRDVVQQDMPFVETLAKVSFADSIKELVVSQLKAAAFRGRERGNP